MIKFINKILLYLLLIALSNTSLAQWVEISNLPQAQQLNCIDAIDHDFIVIGAYPSKLFITSDAGSTWTVKTLPYSSPMDLSLVDRNRFYIAFSNGIFMWTSDGGDHWLTAYSYQQKTTFGNYIEMFSSTDGIAMGDGDPFIRIPVFLKTIDGINWVETCSQPLGGGASDGPSGIDFVDANIGYYSPKGGPPPRKLCKTTDGGFSWTEMDFSVYANVLKFYNKDFGLLINVPNVHVTLDGGFNWETYSFTKNISYSARDIEFVPGRPDIIWVTSAQGLSVSTDSGKTWNKHSDELIKSAYEIVFTNSNVGWIISSSSGKLFFTNNCGGLITNVKGNINIPEHLTLFQNYPNPFNPTTTIQFTIPVRGNVKLKVFDLLGNEVATLVNEIKEPGSYNVIFDGSKLSSGVYFCSLFSTGMVKTRKLILLK